MNYIEQSIIFAYAVTGYVFVPVFDSLIGIPIRTRSSAAGLKIFPARAGIKKCKPIINKKNKNHVKIVLFAKTAIIFLFLGL